MPRLMPERRWSRAFGPVAVAVACCLAVVAGSDVLNAQAKAGSSRTPPPTSQNTPGLITTGRSLFDDQRYDESIQTLSAALLRPGTSKADRIEVYRLLAYDYLVLNRKEEAEAAVRGLYALNPDFSLATSESPRFREFFADTKKRWEADGKPGQTPGTPAAGQSAVAAAPETSKVG